MKTSHILLYYFIAFVFSNTSDGIQEDYIKLVDYANIATIAYCLQKGLSMGCLGHEETNCLLELCDTTPYSSIEVKGTFDLNSWTNICSGYYALDHRNARILLVFRGTASRRDWFKNLDIFQVEYEPLITIEDINTNLNNNDCEDCKVHQGYYTLLKEKREEIIQGITDLKGEYSDYQLAIVGHSLGGALAILTGIEFQLMGLDPLVVSFASPKVGNKNMAKFIDSIFNTPEVTESIFKYRDFEKGFIRVVHKGDIVTKLPPTKIYRHCGFEYYIDTKYLPHNPENIIPIGSSCCGETPDEDEVNISSFNYDNLFSKNVGKYDHSYYFRKITQCDIEI